MITRTGQADRMVDFEQAPNALKREHLFINNHRLSSNEFCPKFPTSGSGHQDKASGLGFPHRFPMFDEYH